MQISDVIYLQIKPVHNWEPSVVTWNYENIRGLSVVTRVSFVLSTNLQMHLTFEGIGPKKKSPRF